MALKIPDDYIPFRFKIARAQNWKVVVALFGIYMSEAFFLLPRLYAQKPGLGTVPKVLGVCGDILALAVLVFSVAVDKYSPNRYVRSYRSKARKDHPNWGWDRITEHLLDYHAKLQMITRNMLTSDVGATLLAISTFLAVIGDFVGGG